MTITNKQIKDLKNLFSQQQFFAEIVSQQLKTIIDRNGTEEVEVERNGQTVKLTIKTLFDEVYYSNGNPCQAREILEKRYSELFRNYEEQKKVDEALKNFTAKNFGFFYTQMTLVNLVDLVLALIRYEIMHFFLIDRIYDFFKTERK